jgi:CelD/BcsL family acetyltransferase involved in cellulose biosynthesis
VLTFDWVTTDDGLDRLRDDWTRLDEGAGPESVFRSWEWQRSWWRALGAGPRRELRVLVARDGAGRARGLLPMYRDDAPVAALVPRRRLRLLGDITVGSDYLGLVAPAAEQDQLAPEFAGALAARAPGADCLELLDLDRGDALPGALASALVDAGFEGVAIAPRYACPFACWDNDLDGYLAARPLQFGSQARRRRRELAREPGFGIEVLSAPDAVAAALDVFFTLHRLRWRAAGGSEAIPDARTEAFHRDVARLCAARGWARLALLHVRGRPAAAAYGFLRRGRLVYYQAGHDPAWRRRSVGTVLLVELMRDAFAAGARELDLLRGEERYKAIWASASRATCAVVARPPTRAARRAARAASALEQARGWVKGHLSAETVRTLRRVIRGAAS